MAELINPVKNGAIDQTSTTTTTKTSTKGTDALGKDAFLQLLVTQMKYQDPLNPNTDTEYVAQLATFSQLEQMQNLSQTSANSQAFGLVGMNVIVKSTDTSGGVTYKSGTVDYVAMSGGKAQLSIEGSLYNIDQLYQVIDSTYLIKQGLPYMPKEVSETFDKANPKDITFDVNLGSGETIATDVAVIINNNILDSKYITVAGNKVTISKDALKDLEDGTYKPTLVFNDALYTTVAGKITLKVEGQAPTEDDNTDDSSNDNPSNSTPEA
ncbi:MAG: flagellar hook capping protein [Anaerocolumna sp.]|jgi:flagellar basal-body rod modification protein FlgD|nr:flagellar hook capping protein [Anaerocolumna sp.]